MEVSLLHFVKQVSDFARERSARRTATENELDMERTTFYIQFRIRILYDFPSDVVSDWQRAVKAERDALKQLETALKVLDGEGPSKPHVSNTAQGGLCLFHFLFKIQSTTWSGSAASCSSSVYDVASIRWDV
jgi:hypothetical protein